MQTRKDQRDAFANNKCVDSSLLIKEVFRVDALNQDVGKSLDNGGGSLLSHHQQEAYAIETQILTLDNETDLKNKETDSLQSRNCIASLEEMKECMP